jgi:hypothetical protein
MGPLDDDGEHADAAFETTPSRLTPTHLRWTASDRPSARSGRQPAEPAERSDRTILAAIGVFSSARVGGRALPL